MIKLLRNKEVKIHLFLHIVLSTIAIILCCFIDFRAALVTVVLSLLLMVVYLFSSYKKYKKITSLAYDINRILHEDYTISLKNYSEGELSILQSEIHKMTIRLREQQQLLLNDKIYLADSIADISHQIRTPLTSINLIVQFLSEPDLPYDRRKQHTNELRRLLSRIDWLITALLKISKLDAGTIQFNKEEISIEEFLKKACSPLLVPIELRGQELVINAKGNFFGDVAWTCEAIGNIVKNCMEHTPEGGKLEIDASENPIYTEFIIKDNGTGIAEEDIPHIFERFYKGVNSSDNSFGIGLALSRTIITNQNGTIKADNRKTSGAMFTIRFYKGAV